MRNHSEAFDFVWVTSSYADRSFGSGCDYQRGPGLSAQLHNKLFYVSNDTATFLASYRSDYDKGVLGYTDTPEKNEMMFRRAAGFNVTNGFYLDILDLDDQFYNDSRLYPIIGNLNAFYDRSKNFSRASNAQVLVVSDEASCSYSSFKKGFNRLLDRALTFVQPQLVKIGAQADHIFVDDIPLLPNPSQYKLVVFLNNHNATDQQRAYVDSLKGNNRTLLFVYAPGYFNGPQFGNALMQSLTGMTLISDPSEIIIKPAINITSDHPIGQAVLAKGITKSGYDLPIGKLFYVNDPAATAIGKHYDNASYTTVAIKDMGTWKSIYSICMAQREYVDGQVISQYDPTLWREIARYAGVHIYSETNDAFYVNESYVCLHPNATAPRTITFPAAVDIYDATTETLLQSNTTSYTWNATLGDTKLLRYVRLQ